MGVAIASARTKTNVAIAAGAVLLWIVMALVTGRGGLNGGPGLEGGGFDGMVRGFTLKGGDEPTRVSPLFPALAWIPYTAIGDVPSSLLVVDAASIAVLVLAACLLIDDRRGTAQWQWKLLVALSLTMAIAFAKVAAFVPGNASLCALAALMLAVALCSPERPMLTAAAHVAAVMALPIGLVAPLYGVVRAARLHVRASRIALMFGPAALMWLFVQWWARGGVAGVLEDFAPHRLSGSVDIWMQPLFLTFALYFLVTAGGGLSLIAFAYPAAWGRMARRSPEAVVLAGAVIVYAITAGGAAPLAFGFLAPVWVLLCVEWSGSLQPRRAWWWFAAGLLLTLVTQRPLAHVDITSYFVDWHPYDVYRGSAPVQYAQLWDRWVPRLLVVGIALWAMALASAWAAPSPAGRADTPPPVDPADEPIGRVSALMPSAVIEPSVALSPDRRWSVASYGYACALAALTGYFLFQIPIQLSDSFGNLLQVQDASLGQLIASQFNGQAYLRPALWAGLKVSFDLASGHYFVWFRAIHVLLLLGVLLTVLAVIRVRDAADLAAAAACLAIVLGLHTFAGTIREAFPINTFLVVALCVTATIAAARARPRPWLDLVPAVLLTYAVFAVETGLLIWVACVAAYLAGYRGISRRGVLLVTAIVAAYFVLRFGVFHIGTPGLAERSTGFGFTRLEPSDLVARFGRNPYPLYAYNVLCGISTVLFGDPRGGVWQFLAGVSQGDLPPWVLINVLSTSLTTALIAAYIIRRRRAWLAWDLNDGDRLVLIFLAVLPANAAISYAYTKDVIMSPAGICYALAAFVAFRDRITIPGGVMMRHAGISTAALLVVSMCWSMRLVGIEYNLRAMAASVRTEWAFEDEWETTNHITIRTPQQVALRQQLYDDAIWRRHAPRQLSLRWPARVFDTTQ